MGRGRKILISLQGEVPLSHLLAVSAVTLAAFLSLIASLPDPTPRHPSIVLASIAFPNENSELPGASPAPAGTESNVRRLYPYSVIPGGVENAQELKNAVSSDPLVASHYADFKLPVTRLTRVDQSKSVYVSYRMGNHIFWTKNRMTLAAGETLITDGEHIARTRCGNRISVTPMAPVSPVEPKPDALEMAAYPEPAAGFVPPIELPLDPPPASVIQVAANSGRIFIPPIIPLWAGSPFGGTPIVPPPPPPPPPVPTSEPDSLLLVSTGLAAAWLRLKNRRR